MSHDLLGLHLGRMPRFVRRYATLAGTMREAFERFSADVKGRSFPDERESY